MVSFVLIQRLSLKTSSWHRPAQRPYSILSTLSSDSKEVLLDPAAPHVLPHNLPASTSPTPPFLPFLFLLPIPPTPYPPPHSEAEYSHRSVGEHIRHHKESNHGTSDVDLVELGDSTVACGHGDLSESDVEGILG